MDRYHCQNSPVGKVHGPWVWLGWVNNEMEFLNPLSTYPDAAHTHCSLTISRDQTTLSVHIISSCLTCETWKGRTVHRNLNCHWLEAILIPLLTVCDRDVSNSLRLIYISNTVYLVCDFLFHLNHFSHPEEGGSMFLESVVTCTTTQVKNPKKKKKTVIWSHWPWKHKNSTCMFSYGINL